MMPDFTTALAIGFVIGFILGYGLRAIISYRRRGPARRRSYLRRDLSFSDGAFCGSPARTKSLRRLAPFSVLKHAADAVATSREGHLSGFHPVAPRRPQYLGLSSYGPTSNT